MTTSSIKRTIVKKRTKKFIRHQKARGNKSIGNFFIKMRTGWRKPKGIDSHPRRGHHGKSFFCYCFLTCSNDDALYSSYSSEIFGEEEKYFYDLHVSLILGTR